MKKLCICVTVLLSVMCGCFEATGERVKMTSPKGFVEYTKDKTYYRAIAADGIVVQIYEVSGVENSKDNRSLSIWQKEIDINLRARGYQFVKQEDIESADHVKGVYLEYIIPYNGELYSYSVVMYIYPDKMFLGETGGAKKFYDTKRSAVLEAFSSVKR